MNKTKDKLHIVIVILSILLGLTLVSWYLLGGIMAKYYTLSSDNDQARVAEWNVNMSSLSGDTNASITKGSAKGTKAVLTFDAINESEVTCEYDILVYGVPKDVTVELFEGASAEGTPKSVLTQTEEDGSALSFEKVGTMPAGSAARTYTLSFKAAISAADSGDTPAEITVGTRFTQKDGE